MTPESKIQFRAKLDDARGYALYAATDRAEGSGLASAVNGPRIGIEMPEQVEELRA